MKKYNEIKNEMSDKFKTLFGLTNLKSPEYGSDFYNSHIREWSFNLSCELKIDIELSSRINLIWITVCDINNIPLNTL